MFCLNIKTRKENLLGVVCLCTLILGGCLPDLEDFKKTPPVDRAQTVCDKNLEVATAGSQFVELRKQIDRTEKVIQNGYHVLEKCKQEQRYDYRLRRYITYELCDREFEPIDRRLEERKLYALRVEEPIVVDKYLAYRAQCVGYVLNLSLDEAYNDYQLPYKRWVKPLSEKKINARRAAIKQIAREFEIKFDAWEARDKGTDTYLLKDTTRLEGKFFDRKGNLTVRGKTVLSAIVGKYAVRADTLSPPTLEIVIPFTLTSDADRFLARPRAENYVEKLRQHFLENLDIERPIQYLAKKTEGDKTNTNTDVIFIHEVAAK